MPFKKVIPARYLHNEPGCSIPESITLNSLFNTAVEQTITISLHRMLGLYIRLFDTRIYFVLGLKMVRTYKKKSARDSGSVESTN